MRHFDSKWVLVVVAVVGAALATGEARAVPAPTDVLGGIGINVFRDLDPQVPTNPDVSFATEDVVGPKGFVGPAGGGQRYDWEGLYAWRDNGLMYVALSTGFRIAENHPKGIKRRIPTPQSRDSALAGIDFRDGGKKHAYAGDILIDLGQDSTWDYGISLGAYQKANGRAGLGYGDLYLIDQTAGHGGTGTYFAARDRGPWLGIAEEDLGTLEHSSEMIWVKQQTGEDMSGTKKKRARFMAVFVIDLALFPDFEGALAFSWTQECGNDFGYLDVPEVPPPTPPPIPEPATLALVAVGAVGLGLWRSRRR